MRAPILNGVLWLLVALFGLVAPASAYAQCARWLEITDQSVPGALGTVDSLVVMPSGDLVAGGRFQAVGSTVASNIARWDGSSWAPLGSGVGGSKPSDPATVLALAVLPNGDIVAA